MDALFNAIQLATLEPNADRALIPVQRILGVPDGGLAGVFFSGVMDDDMAGESIADCWSQLTPAQRRDVAVDYVIHELKLWKARNEP